MKGTALDGRRRRVRSAFIVFIILGLSLLPLRASCHLGWADAAPATSQQLSEHAGGHGQGNPDPCCASIGDSALINAIVPALSAGSSMSPVLMLPVVTLIASGFVVQPLRLAGAPPPSRSYYARSARVLR